MATMNISLPDPLRAFIEERVAEGGYGTVSEYFRELIRADQKRRAEERLEQLLLEGLDSPTTPLTKKDIEAIKQRGLVRIKQRRGK